MKKTSVKVLSLMLALAMLAGCFVTVVSAEDAVACPGKGEKHTDAHVAIATKIGDYVEPACDNYGYQIYRCNLCGDHFMADMKKPTNETHDLEHHDGVAAECEKAGTKAYDECKKCGVFFVENVRYAKGTDIAAIIAIPALEHDYKLVSSTGNCLEEGVATYECSICGDSYDVAVGGTGAGHQWEYVEVTVLPTVNADGTIKAGKALYECVADGCTATTEFDVFCGHNSDITLPAADPDCENNGKTEGKACSICGFVTKKQLPIAANGHKEVIDVAVAPTCTTTGLTEGKHCSVCEKVLVAQDVLKEALCEGATLVEFGAVAGDCTTKQIFAGEKCSICEHVWTEPAEGDFVHSWLEEVVPATCTKYGYSVNFCDLCGYVDQDSFVTIAPSVAGHITYEEAVKLGLAITTVDATCEKDGSHTWICGREGCTEVCTKVIPATGHAKVEVVVDATCSSYGYTYTYCTNEHCDVVTLTDEKDGYAVLDENGDAVKLLTFVVDEEAGFDPENHPEEFFHIEKILNEPTCTTDGAAYVYCEACEYINPMQVLPALGHDFENGTKIRTEAPDCVNQGYDVVKCARCDVTTKMNYVPALGHTPVEVPAKAPGCITVGWTVGSECDVCGTTLVAQRPVPAQKHNYEFVETVLPKCDGTKGYDLYVCENDNCEKTEDKRNETTYAYVADGVNIVFFYSMEVAEHVHGTLTFDETLVTGTCSQDEISTYICGTCGIKIMIQTAAAHTWGDWSDEIPATCTGNGTEPGRTCSACGEKEGYDVIPAPGHAFDKKNSDDTNHWVECSVCGTIKEGTLAEHVWGEGEVTTDPTCTDDGVRTFTCTCGDTKTAVEPATDHDWSTEYDWTEYDFEKKVNGEHWFDCLNGCGEKSGKAEHVYTAEVVLEPDCNTMGKTKYTCVCGYSYELTDIPALGCNFVATGVSSDLDCVNEQYDEFECSRCGKIELRNYLPALGHDNVDDAYVAPDCDSTGLTAGYHCANGCAYPEANLAQKEIPATGKHFNAAGEELIDSCTNKHITDRDCTTCDDEDKRIDITCDDKHEQRIIVAPTCVDEGYTIISCDDCGRIKDVVEPTAPIAGNHKYGAYVETKAPTCTDKGTEAKTCEYCGDVQTRDIKANGHTAGAYAFDDDDHWKVCADCGIKLDATVADHRFNKKEIIAAAPGVTGKIELTCVCGKVEYEYPEFPDLVVSFDYNSGTANRKDAAIVNGGLVVLNVYLEGTNAEVENVQIKFNYDASRLSFVNIDYTNAEVKFDYPVATIANGSAVIFFAGAADGFEADDDQTVTGAKQLVASITFRVDDYADKFEPANQIPVKSITTPIYNFDATAYKADGTDFIVEEPDKALAIEIVKLGAVTGDLAVDGGDLIAIKNLIGNGYAAEADINRDGNVTVLDYLELVNYLGGKCTYDVFATNGK